jgi:hypothetical protein
MEFVGAVQAMKRFFELLIFILVGALHWGFWTVLWGVLLGGAFWLFGGQFYFGMVLGGVGAAIVTYLKMRDDSYFRNRREARRRQW